MMSMDEHAKSIAFWDSNIHEYRSYFLQCVWQNNSSGSEESSEVALLACI